MVTLSRFANVLLVLMVAATGIGVSGSPARAAAARPLPAFRETDRARPFAKTLCLSNAPAALCGDASPALPGSFVVPSVTSTGEHVKQLVIEFVSGSCVGTGRATFVQIFSRPPGTSATAPTGDNFSDNFFPLAVAQAIGGAGTNGAQAFSQAARIYLEPGMVVAMSFDFAASGVLNCRAHLGGRFLF